MLLKGNSIHIYFKNINIWIELKPKYKKFIFMVNFKSIYLY